MGKVVIGTKYILLWRAITPEVAYCARCESFNLFYLCFVVESFHFNGLPFLPYDLMKIFVCEGCENWFSEIRRDET